MPLKNQSMKVKSLTVYFDLHVPRFLGSAVHFIAHMTAAHLNTSYEVSILMILKQLMKPLFGG